MHKTKQQFLLLVLSVSISSLLTAYFILASWNDPSSNPPAGNVAAPLNTGLSAQTKWGGLTVDTSTTSGGFLYLDDSTEGDIERVHAVIGYNDLFLKSDQEEQYSIQMYASELNFYAYEEGPKWQIDSAGTLATGSVPWERLTDFPSSVCPEGQYIVEMNEDGTFECGPIDYCEIIHKCAKSDGEGGCIPKGEGEYGLPACQRCSDDSLDPVYFEVDEYDDEGENVCNAETGLCWGCNGNGNCSFQTSDGDAGEQCGRFDCFTGFCSGTGFSCGTYTVGKHGCDSCMKCDPDGTGTCINQTTDEDLGNDCSESECYNGYCNGSGSCGYQDSDEDLWDVCDESACSNGNCSGSSNLCQIYTSGQHGCAVCQGCNANGECEDKTTDWGAGDYSCSAGSEEDPNRCYFGSCINCGGWGNAGYCWYLGSDGQSCIDVCVAADPARGGPYNGDCKWNNDPEDCSTCRHYLGPSAPCNPNPYGPLWHYYYASCYYYNDDDASSDCNWGAHYVQRMCACNH
jgi:hypothetical protein